MSITGSEQWMYSSGAAGFYDFPIEQSLRFEDGDSPRLTRALSHNRKTFTISFWFKRANLGRLFLYGNYTSGTTVGALEFDPDDRLDFYDYATGYRFQLKTTRAFRDVGTWYHLILQVDTTQSTSSDRVKMYINGVQETNFVSETYPSQNLDSIFGDGGTHAIGTEGTNNRLFFDGYLADWNLIDGQALDATSFGETKSGIWIPKDTSGLTFGTNGFRLEYADSAAIGDDTSGNTNDWTVNNLVASDVVLDSPTNNFAVMNPLAKAGSGGITFSEGNLKIAVADNGNARSNFVMDSGKWYWEAMVVGGASVATIGIAEDGYYSGNLFDTASTAKGYIYINDGNKRSSLAASATAYGASYTTNDIIGVAYDADNGTVTFYKNNTTQGTAYTGLSGGHSAYFQGYGGTATWVLNTGADSTFAGNTTAGGNADENGIGDFKYAPPSGFLSLCSANLPSGAIDTLADETPEDYFNTVTFTGTGSSNSVTGVGFEPSLSWFKNRSAAYSHQLVDQVRGKIGSDSSFARLASNLTNAEATPGGDDGLTSFDSDGFTVLGDESYNSSGQSMVAWNWKANGSGVSNTDGSITSTVSVGATSQQNWFSVVSWTGTGANATVGHGLGQTPSLIINKPRGIADNWISWAEPLGATGYIYLNLTNASATGASVWNSTLPTADVFSVGTSSNANPSGGTMISYCFANADGLCKVGKFSGNGSTTDGTFVYTGFRPAFLLYKQTTAAANWEIIDNTRNPYNVSDARLFSSNSIAEVTNETVVDLLSNGFKARDAYGGWNFSGQDYIYLAIAEQDFRFANAR